MRGLPPTSVFNILPGIRQEKDKCPFSEENIFSKRKISFIKENALKGLLRELLELWEVAEDQGWSSLGDWEQGPIGRSSKLIHLED